MFEWFESLTALQKIFAYIAIPSSVVLLIQTLLLLLGIGDGDADIDMDTSIDIDSTDPGGDGLALFSVRGIMAMLCVGSWSGIVLLGSGLNSIVAIVLSIVIGILALIGMAFLMKQMGKLQSSGNINIENAIGKVGQVYITIPAKLKGAGKINIVVQEKYTEFEAITNDSESIKSGEPVRVVATDQTGILVVERIIKSDENK